MALLHYGKNHSKLVGFKEQKKYFAFKKSITQGYFHPCVHSILRENMDFDACQGQALWVHCPLGQKQKSFKTLTPEIGAATKNTLAYFDAVFLRKGNVFFNI